MWVNLFIEFILAFVTMATILGHTRKTFHSSVICFVEVQFTLKSKTGITLVALEIFISMHVEVNFEGGWSFEGFRTVCAVYQTMYFSVVDVKFSTCFPN